MSDRSRERKRFVRKTDVKGKGGGEVVRLTKSRVKRPVEKNFEGAYTENGECSTTESEERSS